jgi:predicted branched-subunit amino acid permease
MTPEDKPVTITSTGMLLGARLVMPLMPGLIVFAAAFGTAAAQKKLTLLEALLSSGVVFAGAAQLISLELWRENWSAGSIIAISLVVFTVNARMLLMGASLHSWFSKVPGRALWPTLFFFTDANWLIAERYKHEGGRDFGIMIGSGAALWVMWVTGTIPGYLAGTLVDNPARYGLDLVMPIIFSAMSVPMWKGRRSALPWLPAAIAAVITYELVPGYSFIVVGALTGALAGALLPPEAGTAPAAGSGRNG